MEDGGALQGRRSGSQPVGVDLDPARRPGVPRLRQAAPLPNTIYPVEPQRDVKVFMHARPHRNFPPVFGTAVPPRGISGLVRKAAYGYPDHAMRHWALLLLSDRIDLWEHRARKVARFAAPAVAALGALALMRAHSRG
jgi:hypothetical protein